MSVEKMHNIQLDNHFETLLKSLQIFSKTNVLTDGSIITRSCRIAVHRQVLSSATSYFEDFLEDRTVQNCSFIFNNFHDSVFDKIVELIYNGTVDIAESDSTGFRSILKQLNVDNFQSSYLARKCEETFTLPNHRESFTNSLWISRSTLQSNQINIVTKDLIETNVHSIVLCANSDLILNILIKQKLRNRPYTFILDNVSKESLDKIVEFCYKGTVSVEQEMLRDVYDVAHLLGVEQLCKQLCSVDPLLQSSSSRSSTDIVCTIKTSDCSSNAIGSGTKELFKSLINCEHLTDISVLAGNALHSVHLVVLAKFSPYFQSLMQNCKVIKDSFLLVKDLDKNQMQSLIEYVYKGETEFNGRAKDFRYIMSKWIDFDLLPISEAEERQILSPESTGTTSTCQKSTRIEQIHVKSELANAAETTADLMNAAETANTCEAISTTPLLDGDHENPKKLGVEDDECQDEPADDVVEDELLQTKPPRTLRSISCVCNTCGLDLKTRAAFRKHLTIHPSARIIKCQFCGKGFTRPSQLELHERIHTGLQPHMCQVCGKGFSAKSSMTKHLTTHGTEKFVCDICNKGFTRKEYIEEHLRTHSGSKPYECTVCQKTFVGRTGLNHHQRTHNGMKGAVCEVCGKSFTRHGLWTHMKTHDKTFKCVTCHKYFSTSTSLRIHNLGSHLNQRGHQCHTCGKSFFQRNHLTRHMKVHRKVENVVFKCDKCLKTYKSEAKFRSHVEVDHTELDSHRYSCNICHKKFAGRSTVIYHQRSHTGERPHTCLVCGKHFTRPDALQTHALTHRERQLSHQCPVCQQSFATKRAVKKHRDLNHDMNPLDSTDIPDYKSTNQCTVCNKIFKSEKKLLTHVANHSQKKFPCDICSKQFRCETNLTKHRLNVHSVPVPIPAELPPIYSFQVCSSSYTTVTDYSNANTLTTLVPHTIRRPYSINIDGNLCCNTDENDLLVAPAMFVPDLQVHQVMLPITTTESRATVEPGTVSLDGVVMCDSVRHELQHSHTDNR